MDNLEERFKALQEGSVEKGVQLCLAINDLYGMFCVYFDPGNQGLDPIPQIMTNSLNDAISQAEIYLQGITP